MCYRSLLVREEALQKRRREAEELLQWHQRLKEEEMKIAQLEQAANSIPNIPEQPKIITGAQLNRFWRNITGLNTKKFEDRKKFSMSQNELEQFFLDARKIFREVSDENSLDGKVQSRRKSSFTDYVSDFEIASSIKTLDNVLDSVSSSFVNHEFAASSGSEKSHKTVVSDAKSVKSDTSDISDRISDRQNSGSVRSFHKDSINKQYSNKTESLSSGYPTDIPTDILETTKDKTSKNVSLEKPKTLTELNKSVSESLMKIIKSEITQITESKSNDILESPKSTLSDIRTEIIESNTYNPDLSLEHSKIPDIQLSITQNIEPKSPIPEIKSPNITQNTLQTLSDVQGNAHELSPNSTLLDIKSPNTLPNIDNTQKSSDLHDISPKSINSDIRTDLNTELKSNDHELSPKSTISDIGPSVFESSPKSSMSNNVSDVSKNIGPKKSIFSNISEITESKLSDLSEMFQNSVHSSVTSIIVPNSSKLSHIRETDLDIQNTQSKSSDIQELSMKSPRSDTELSEKSIHSDVKESSKSEENVEIKSSLSKPERSVFDVIESVKEISEKISDRSWSPEVKSPFSDIRETIREISERLHTNTTHASHSVSDMKPSNKSSVSQKLSSDAPVSEKGILNGVSEIRKSSVSSDLVISENHTSVNHVFGNDSTKATKSDVISERLDTCSESQIFEIKPTQISGDESNIKSLNFELDVSSQAIESNVKSSQIESSDVKLSQFEPSEAKTSQFEPSEAKTSQFEPYVSETRTSEPNTSKDVKSESLNESTKSNRTVRSLESMLSTLEHLSKISELNQAALKQNIMSPLEQSSKLSDIIKTATSIESTIRSELVKDMEDISKKIEDITKRSSRETESDTVSKMYTNSVKKIEDTSSDVIENTASNKIEDTSSNKSKTGTDHFVKLQNTTEDINTSIENKSSKEATKSQCEDTHVSLSLDLPQPQSKVSEDITSTKLSSKSFKTMSKSSEESEESERTDYDIQGIEVKVSEPISLEISVKITTENTSKDIEEIEDEQSLEIQDHDDSEKTKKLGTVPSENEDLQINEKESGENYEEIKDIKEIFLNKDFKMSKTPDLSDSWQTLTSRSIDNASNALKIEDTSKRFSSNDVLAALSPISHISSGVESARLQSSGNKEDTGSKKIEDRSKKALTEDDLDASDRISRMSTTVGSTGSRNSTSNEETASKNKNNSISQDISQRSLSHKENSTSRSSRTSGDPALQSEDSASKIEDRYQSSKSKTSTVFSHVSVDEEGTDKTPSSRNNKVNTSRSEDSPSGSEDSPLRSKKGSKKSSTNIVNELLHNKETVIKSQSNEDASSSEDRNKSLKNRLSPKEAIVSKSEDNALRGEDNTSRSEDRSRKYAKNIVDASNQLSPKEKTVIKSRSNQDASKSEDSTRTENSSNNSSKSVLDAFNQLSPKKTTLKSRSNEDATKSASSEDRSKNNLSATAEIPAKLGHLISNEDKFRRKEDTFASDEAQNRQYLENLPDLLSSRTITSDEFEESKRSTDDDVQLLFPPKPLTDDSYNSEFDIDLDSGAKSERSTDSNRFSYLDLNLKDLNSDTSSLSSTVDGLETVKESPESRSSSNRDDFNGSGGVSHIDVRKRVSEILADTSGTVTRGDKSPRLQDFYVTTYDVMSPSPGSSPEIGSPTGDLDSKEKVNLVRKTIYGNEAEELRRKQLEIEQEIKRLEQQQKENVPYCFMREIPNKPPPPYKPPVTITPTVTTVIPTEVRQIKTYISKASDILYTDHINGSLSEKSSANIGNKINSYRFVFDLCKEIALDIQEKTKVDESVPSWMQLKPRLKPTELNKTVTKAGLEALMNRKVQQLLGFQSVNRKDNLIVRWSRKKRDHVDEILVLESQTEEPDWTNYDRDALIVKDNLVKEILDTLVGETCQMMSAILRKRICDL